MKPVYRDSSSNTVLSVRKDTGRWIDFSKQISGSLQDLVKLSLNCASEDEAMKWSKSIMVAYPLIQKRPKQQKLKKVKFFAKAA